jgi:hypothetical protein
LRHRIILSLEVWSQWPTESESERKKAKRKQGSFFLP